MLHCLIPLLKENPKARWHNFPARWFFGKLGWIERVRKKRQGIRTTYFHIGFHMCIHIVTVGSKGLQESPYNPIQSNDPGGDCYWVVYFGSCLPGADRLQQKEPVVVAMDFHVHDKWGIHLPDDTACFLGRRVDLECSAILNDVVWATSISKGVPSMTVKCDFPNWLVAYFDVGRTFTVTDFELAEVGEQRVISAKSDELLPVLHPIPGHRAVAEAFAGIGGWSFGAAQCGVIPTILIEADLVTAQACAKSHGLPVHSIMESFTLASTMQLPDAWVLCADITDYKVHVICGLVGVTAWLASPPCQPWSKAGWQKGFVTVDGGVFACFLYATALSKPIFLNLENVPGLPDHPHFPILLHILQEAGWCIVNSGVEQIYPVLPIMRARWLATCISKSVKVDPKNIRIAESVQLPEVVPGLGHDNSPAKFGCLNRSPQEWELKQCVPDKEAIEAMSCPGYLPLKHRIRNYRSMDPSQVFQLRITNGNRPLPNAMASQGSQHLLPHDLLTEKGLHAYLVNDGLNLRFITPIEICIAMGFPSKLVLPSDFLVAWKIAGNALTVPHAALQCLRAHYVLGSQSIFQHGIRGPLELCERVLNSRFPISDFKAMPNEGWMSLVLINENVDVLPSIPATIVVSDDEGVTQGEPARDDPYLLDDDEPPSKRPCISPTWQFRPDDLAVIPELQKDDFPNCASWTVGIKHLVSGLTFEDAQLMPCPESCTAVKILHSQGSWIGSKLVQGHPNVSDAIREFFPHAIQEHFQEISLNDQAVWFGTSPFKCTSFDIKIKPFCFLRIVQAQWLPKDLPVEVDVAWTFADLIAFVACEAAVFPSSIQLETENRVMLPSVFVLAENSVAFMAKLVQSRSAIVQTECIATCEYPSCDEGRIGIHCVSQLPPSNHDDSAAPIRNGFVRFTTRHPKWGSVRSVTVAESTSAKDLVQILIPGFDSHAPQICVDEVLIDPSESVLNFPKGNMELIFQGERPWPAVQLVMTIPFQRSGCPGEFCVKDVKGPFDSRPKSCKIPLDWTVLHLVASYLDLHSSNLTLLVLQNGRSVDPRLFVQQAEPATIDIRVCALPGGAKNSNDQIAKKLAEILQKRGVPSVDKDSRAALILSKIPHSEVTAILSKNEFDAWAELKKKANEQKIRMITSTELKEFQQAQRKNKAAIKPTAANQKTKGPKGPKSANMDPNHVTIDLSHFSCDGKTPVPLKVTQWGPDSKGIAIATPTEAKKLLPVTNLSADGLALLVLTDKLFENKPPFTMPAVDALGSPMLAAGVLLNFGDIEIKYVPSLPAASLNEVPTATLEVTIQKKLVPKWGDVQNPLNYLGLQLPEIRSEKVIQSWNFRPYNDDRARVKHSDATYVHGFVKIPEELLLSTLQRSGLAGVFLQVKGSDRKLDPRFGLVVTHGSSLDDLLKLAKITKDVLGVVQLGQQQIFGLRAKREHLAAVRRCVLPQGIAIQEGDIPPDATWWFLKNLKASTTCADLTRALQCLGWNASAIRPGGKFSWIVCSNDDPPATHLCLNDDYVAVVPMKQSNQDPLKPTPTGVKVVQADFSMCPEDSDTTTVATRLTSLSTDLEDRLTSMINEKIQACDSKITAIHQSFESLKVDVETNSSQTQMELDFVKDQQANIQAHLGSVETSIASSSTALMSQMQGLFQQMQNSLNSRFDSLGSGEVKRSRSRSEAKRTKNS